MVTIIPVTNKRQLGLFVDLPDKLFHDDPTFVPLLRDSEIEVLDKARNPARAFCEWEMYLAYKNGKPVGRVCALLNKAYNEKWNQNRVRFCRLDFIDDAEVADALMEKVSDFARAKGAAELQGPIGFCDFDPEGMQVEGFQERNLMITLFTPPYYPQHMDRMGFKKDVDWVEYQLPVPKEGIPRVKKVSDYVLKRSGLHVMEFKKPKDVIRSGAAKEILDLVDVAYAPLYGTVPITEEMKQMRINQYFSMLNLDYLVVLADENNHVKAFGLAVPGLERALKKTRGKIFPFGWILLLPEMKRSKHLDLLLVAVTPELQGRGLNSVLLALVNERAIKNGIEYAETGPNLETNLKVQEQWKMVEGARQHKRRRCYVRSV